MQLKFREDVFWFKVPEVSVHSCLIPLRVHGIELASPLHPKIEKGKKTTLL